MILSCSRVTAKFAVVTNSFMYRVNVSLEICLLCCFIITFGARVPIYPMDLTDVLEQVSFLISSVFALVALEFFSFVYTFYVRLEVGSPFCFKFTQGKGTLIHGCLGQSMTALLYLDTGVEHHIHLRFFILKKKYVIMCIRTREGV